MNDFLPSAEAWFQSLIEPDTRALLKEWYQTAPSRPLVLTDILKGCAAVSLAHELEQTDLWQEEHWLFDSKGEGVDKVGREVFASAQTEQRFSHSYALPDDAVINGPLRCAGSFLSALSDGVVAGLMSEVTGNDIQATPICEFARYQRNNFLTEHSDTFDGRRIGMVLYLSRQSWDRSYGGELGYRNEMQQEEFIVPKFNTAALFPFRTDCQHWVTPLASHDATRYSVAIHYRDRVSTH